MTSPVGGPPEGAFVVGGRFGQDITEESAKHMMSNGVKTSFGKTQVAFKKEYNDVRDDHTKQITELRQEFDQMTIWGNSRTFTGRGTYRASPGTIRAEVIMIGSGAGGGAGAWNAILGASSGGGGGGGGENHFVIPGAALFEEDGTPKAIAIEIGEGGAGGQTTRANGWGGGNTSILDIIVGGGSGGSGADAGGAGGAGGFGMIPGGDGGSMGWLETVGDNNYVSHPTTPGGSSISPYDMHGGGGGGGAGGTTNSAYSEGSKGGNGGVAPGGQYGRPDGSKPSALLPTGGGGGWGTNLSWGGSGGSGGFPGGGGGGGAAGRGSNSWSRGGPGANGIIWIIEHAS